MHRQNCIFTGATCVTLNRTYLIYIHRLLFRLYGFHLNVLAELYGLLLRFHCGFPCKQISKQVGDATPQKQRNATQQHQQLVTLGAQGPTGLTDQQTTLQNRCPHCLKHDNIMLISFHDWKYLRLKGGQGIKAIFI